MKTDLFAPVTLESGVRVTFADCTNRYYGDYHRVCIEVILSFARDDYSNSYKFQTLERMGVSGDDVVAVQTQLIEAFKGGTMVYMVKDNFAEKFILAYKKRKPALLAGLR